MVKGNVSENQSTSSTRIQNVHQDRLMTMDQSLGSSFETKLKAQSTIALPPDDNGTTASKKIQSIFCDSIAGLLQFYLVRIFLQDVKATR